MAAIVGAVLGAAVVGLAVLVGVLVACVMCRRRKRKNGNDHHPPTSTARPLGDNPVYEGTLCTHIPAARCLYYIRLHGCTLRPVIPLPCLVTCLQ